MLVVVVFAFLLLFAGFAGARWIRPLPLVMMPLPMMFFL